MNYKIIFNIPNEKYPTEVTVTDKQMDAIAPALNRKEIVKINGNYFNASYFAKATPDVEANLIEASKNPQIEQYSQSTQDANRNEELIKLREKLKGKFKWQEK